MKRAMGFLLCMVLSFCLCACAGNVPTATETMAGTQPATEVSLGNVENEGGLVEVCFRLQNPEVPPVSVLKVTPPFLTEEEVKNAAYAQFWGIVTYYGKESGRVYDVWEAPLLLLSMNTGMEF